MADDVGQPIIDLKDYLRAVSARKWQVVAVALAVVIAVVALTLLQPRTYVAEAKVVVLPMPDSAALLEAKMNTEAQLVRSEEVATAVSASLKTAGTTDPDALLRGLRVASVPNTTILLIGYASPSPETAAEFANGFAEAYVRVRTQALAAPIEQRIPAYRARIARLQRQIAEQPRNADALQALKQDLAQQVVDLRTRAETKQGGQIVEPAEASAAPASPDLGANTVLALAGGLVLGVLVAVVRDAFDRRVRSREDLERRVGAPVLAVVPRVTAWETGDQPQFTSPRTRDLATEAYGTLATSVRYGGSQYLLKVLTVTSALPGEGKTMTTAHLAVGLAEAGFRVLVISADLRRPRIQAVFGLDGGPGLTDAVTGSAPLSDVIVPTSVEMLSLIRSGPLPDNPVALLARLQASTLLSELRKQYDMVICDTPPVLPVADAAILASVSDGVVFVHSPLKSSRQAVTESRDRLRVAGAKIIGVVYNSVDARGRGKYFGAYSGGYPDDARAPKVDARAPNVDARAPNVDARAPNVDARAPNDDSLRMDPSSSAGLMGVADSDVGQGAHMTDTPNDDTDTPKTS